MVQDRGTLSENEMLRVTKAFEKCIARGGSPIGASPITRRKDHPILRLRGVLVNKRL